MQKDWQANSTEHNSDSTGANNVAMKHQCKEHQVRQYLAVDDQGDLRIEREKVVKAGASSHAHDCVSDEAKIIYFYFLVSLSILRTFSFNYTDLLLP